METKKAPSLIATIPHIPVGNAHASVALFAATPFARPGIPARILRIGAEIRGFCQAHVSLRDGPPVLVRPQREFPGLIRQPVGPPPWQIPGVSTTPGQCEDGSHCTTRRGNAHKTEIAESARFSFPGIPALG